ncbi:hypothetical protein PR202_ga30421 [Eleusine coracana subsp. coracana]|uniref:Uncharacterized protein n=1 Tax=Eleusine coracana subsp. coracana TaxID=191504 RepID=A0AAV5DNY7_ELECO|nr:hypothetical protein PR202_ga30421 [Eleusine coracana subsp. coracana]
MRLRGHLCSNNAGLERPSQALAWILQEDATTSILQASKGKPGDGASAHCSESIGLWTREENEIAIVSHSGFLFHTLSMYSKECHPAIQQEVSKQ